MSIEAGLGLVSFENLAEAFDVFPESLGRHRGVLDKRHRLGVSGSCHRQSQRGLAEFPDQALLLGRVGSKEVSAHSAATQVLFEPLESPGEVVGLVALDFDQQDAGRVALDEPSQRFEFGLADGMREDHAVEQFHGRRLMFQDHGHGTQCVEQVIELDAQQGSPGGDRDQPERGFEHQCQRAFGADDHSREVVWPVVAGGELIEVIASDAAEQFRVSPLDFLGMFGGQPEYRLVAIGQQSVGVGVGLGVVEHDHAAVGQHHRQAFDIVDGLAVDDRACAGGVVADHASEGGSAGGREVQWQGQAVGPQRVIEFIEHDAGLDPDTIAIGLEFDELAEVLGEVELQSGPDGLSRLRSASAASGDRDAVFAAEGQHPGNILGVPGPDDPGGHDLVDAGVGGVHRPGGRVDADIAVETVLQLVELCI